MQISKIEIRNFRGFEKFDLSLNPHFTLLIGVNGTGKTSLLSAISIALGIWHVSKKGTGWRKIEPHEIRLQPHREGDRLSFEQCKPVEIKANGTIGGEIVSWARMIKDEGSRTTNVQAKRAIGLINKYLDDAKAHRRPLPLLAFYGAGRAWLPSNERAKPWPPDGKQVSRWDAYYGSLDERIRVKDVLKWFVLEAAARDTEGKFRPGYEAVCKAIKMCLPGADDLWFDHQRLEPVIGISGRECLFSNLSDGQKGMTALVADLAIKAVTLNSYLLSDAEPDHGSSDLPAVLRETPGVVLIDELDVHLHPKWQRRVAKDLRNTFPKVQFVCASHSPQIIGELQADEIVNLEDGHAYSLTRAMGLDSSRVLEELMGAPSRNEDVDKELKKLADLIDNEDFSSARKVLAVIEGQIGSDDPEVTRARTLVKFMENGE